MSCVTWGRPVGFLTFTLGVCLIVLFILLKVLRAYCALTPLPLSTGYNNRTYEKVLVGITLQKGKGDVFRQPFSPVTGPQHTHGLGLGTLKSCPKNPSTVRRSPASSPPNPLPPRPRLQLCHSRRWPWVPGAEPGDLCTRLQPAAAAGQIRGKQRIWAGPRGRADRTVPGGEQAHRGRGGRV